MTSENIHQPSIEQDNKQLSLWEQVDNNIQSCSKEELTGIANELESTDLSTYLPEYDTKTIELEEGHGIEDLRNLKASSEVLNHPLSKNIYDMLNMI